MDPTRRRGAPDKTTTVTTVRGDGADPHEQPTVAATAETVTKLLDPEDGATVTVPTAVDTTALREAFDTTVLAAPDTARVELVDPIDTGPTFAHTPGSWPDRAKPHGLAMMADDSSGVTPTDIVDRVLHIPSEKTQPTLPPEPRDKASKNAMRQFPELAERYDIGQVLGAGTFGRVYAAVDRKLGRPVALKILYPQYEGEARRRFLQEARVASSIEHPGIVSVLDAGETSDGTAFIVMELLRGESLLARLERNRRLPSAKVIEIGRQVAAALAAAHEAGVIHRDLKPANIHIVPDSATTIGERVKVLDFGLAKFQQSALSTRTILGTPEYMSPEQCRSSANVDFRTDIYSFGCCLYHLAAGRPPFDGPIIDVIKSQESVIPPQLSSLVPDVDPLLEDLVANLLAKNPSDRPRSMKDVERMLATMMRATSREREVLRARSPRVQERRRDADAGRGISLGSLSWPIMVMIAVAAVITIMLLARLLR